MIRSELTQIVGIFLLLLGSGMTVALLAIEPTNYEYTKGTIVSTEIKTVEINGRSLFATPRYPTRRATHLYEYFVTGTYSYTVAGRQYEGATRDLYRGMSLEDARTTASESVGRWLHIAYYPDNHAYSVPKSKEDPSEKSVLLCFFIALIFVGSFMIASPFLTSRLSEWRRT